MNKLITVLALTATVSANTVGTACRDDVTVCAQGECCGTAEKNYYVSGTNIAKGGVVLNVCNKLTATTFVNKVKAKPDAAGAVYTGDNVLTYYYAEQHTAETGVASYTFKCG